MVGPLRRYCSRMKVPCPLTTSSPPPALWDIDSPNLYTAEVRLVGEDNVTLDAASARFGIRKAEWVFTQGIARESGHRRGRARELGQRILKRAQSERPTVHE